MSAPAPCLRDRPTAGMATGAGWSSVTSVRSMRRGGRGGHSKGILAGRAGRAVPAASRCARVTPQLRWLFARARLVD
jgi:hypothetical protein